MSIHNKQKNTGFSLLFVALIIASVTTVASFTFSSAGMSAFRVNRLAENRFILSNISATCFERVMMQVRNTPESSLGGTMTIGEGSCEYDVVGSIPFKTVTTTAIVDSRELEKETTITALYPVLVIE